MSNLVSHAKRELELLGLFSGGKMDEAMGRHVLRMVEEFSREGHSGFSAAYAVGLLEKLLRFEPLTPLTGDGSEWIEVGPDGLCQNNRCSHVFRDGDGNSYDIDGRVFLDENGCGYTNQSSRVPVEFPYTPATEYVSHNQLTDEALSTTSQQPASDKQN